MNDGIKRIHESIPKLSYQNYALVKEKGLLKNDFIKSRPVSTVRNQ